MNRLEAMQIYVRVAEQASFTRTAESLGLPKASVSNAVQQLEAALGTRLLHRTTRKVRMTQDGQAYYERCKDLLADLDELNSLFQRNEQALRGRIRVDMSSGMARKHVLPQLPQFLAAHPQIEIELSSTDRYVDLVREGFDCVVMARALIHDAQLVNKFRSGTATTSGCTACNECVVMMYTPGGTSCVLQAPNDAEMNRTPAAS